MILSEILAFRRAKLGGEINGFAEIYNTAQKTRKHKLWGQKMSSVLFISETLESPFLAKTERVGVRNNWSFCGAKRSAFFHHFSLAFHYSPAGQGCGWSCCSLEELCGQTWHWRGATLQETWWHLLNITQSTQRLIYLLFPCIPFDSWRKDNREKSLEMTQDDFKLGSPKQIGASAPLPKI